MRPFWQPDVEFGINPALLGDMNPETKRRQGYALIGFTLLLSLLTGGCRTSTPVSQNPPAASLPAGETEVITYCSGPEYSTSNEVFRANAVGESIDLSVARRKAMSNARSELAASIQTTVRGVTDSYTNANENNNQEQLGERYEGFSREVVSQELRGMRLNCEKFTRTAEGKYKAYVAIELSAQHLVDAYYQRLTSNQSVVADPGYEKFKQLFEEQMTKGKQD